MNNVCFFIGRISKDLELKYTKDKKPVLDLPLAITNGKDDTTFVTISVFGNVAESINNYCNKGDLVGVKAMLKNHNWEDAKGNKHYEFNFIANQVTFLSKKKTDDKKEEKVPEVKTNYEETDIKITDADLPF